MCYLCDRVEYAKNPTEGDAKVHHIGPFCVIIDSIGDKPSKDGFARKLVIYRQHMMEPNPTIRDAMIEIAKIMFPTRRLWFPQTEDNTEKGKRLPLGELAAHWYFLIE